MSNGIFHTHVCRAVQVHGSSLLEEEKYALIFNHTPCKEYEYMACMLIADLEFEFLTSTIYLYVRLFFF